MTRIRASLMFAPILGLIAACSSPETSESSASVLCDVSDCDSAPPSSDATAASQICDDGTVAGLSCAAESTGTCGWTIVQCPADHDDPPPVGCDDCDGEAPDVPSQLCKDGTVAGPACVATSDGTCGWTITQCPDSQPTDCTADGCAAGQHCETDCYPCDAPDPKTPCDSFACQSTCVPD